MHRATSLRFCLAMAGRLSEVYENIKSSFRNRTFFKNSLNTYEGAKYEALIPKAFWGQTEA